MKLWQFVLIVVLLVVLFPLGIIWSINVLWHFNLEYSTKNWIAAAVFSIGTGGINLNPKNWRFAPKGM